MRPLAIAKSKILSLKNPKFSLKKHKDEFFELVNKTDHRVLAVWAINCAERVLPCFEEKYPEDHRPRRALETLQVWINTGVFKMADIRKASLASHAAAREVGEDNAARSAARAAGQAVATAHVPAHSIGAVIYALQAIYRATDLSDADAAIAKERDWQYHRLLKLVENSKRLNSKSMPMEEQLIAPCGMNCGVCASYLAMKNDLKKMGFGKTYCAGCLPRGKGCYYKKRCDILDKGLVRFCYECSDFPCRHLQTLDKRYRTFYHMSMIENLEFIKTYGIDKFLEKETAKWRCPVCRGVICCHNGICYSCGLDKLRQKKRKSRWGD